jgi:hypothetical protein
LSAICVRCHSVCLVAWGSTVEIAIGIFDSTERAEQAVKELRQNQVPGQAIIFLTASENEAMSFTKEIGAYVGGVMGGRCNSQRGRLGRRWRWCLGLGRSMRLG